MDLPKLKHLLPIPPISIAPGDTQDNWTNNDSAITDFSTQPVIVRNVGEIVYDGVSLHEIVGKTPSESANYAWQVRFLGTKDLAATLRFRRQDSSNFLSLKLNSTNQIIQLTKTENGIESLLTEAGFALQFQGVYKYILEAWTLDDVVYGFINGFKIVQATTSFVQFEPGFSLYFPSVGTADPPAIFNFSVLETEAYNNPEPLLDGSNLLWKFRISLKDQIENPSERTWDTYKEALKLYGLRNVGQTDSAWEQLGYPIRKPNAAEWFH